MTITCGEESISVIASFTPSDSFRDLTNALFELLRYDGEATIVFHEEPAETELRFFRLKEMLRLEIWFFHDDRREDGKGENVLVATGSYEDICIPFWRALRSLQGRFSPEELDARWHRPFPCKEIDLLTKAIREKFS